MEKHHGNAANYLGTFLGRAHEEVFMTYLYISLLWFVSTVILHIALSKFRMIFRIPWGVPLGAFILGIVSFTITTPSILGVTLYIALTAAYVAVSASPSLGDESPSSKIVLELIKKGALSQKQIVTLFNREDLISKRLRDLISSGWVQEDMGVLIVTPVGKRFTRIFLWLRNILGLA